MIPAVAPSPISGDRLITGAVGGGPEPANGGCFGKADRQDDERFVTLVTNMMPIVVVDDALPKKMTARLFSSSYHRGCDDYRPGGMIMRVSIPSLSPSACAVLQITWPC